MLEESAPSIWAAVHGWFTPTVLFVLLNCVIGTIAVTSKGFRPHRRDDEDRHDGRLKLQPTRSVLDRLKSINLYRYRSEEIPLETAPAAPPHARVEPVEAFETLDDAYENAVAAGSSLEHHFIRSQSDSHPAAGEMPGKLAGKLKKSASAKSAFSHFEEAEIPRRPETTREVGSHGTVDEEVDAKADDFINRFRQQLKLQRLDSIIRYKEMLNRGK